MTEQPNSFGYVYHNPETGLEWAEQHPIDSGEVPDATDIQAADLAVLHSNLLLAWQENAILRTEKHADAEAIAAMKQDAAMDRLVAEGQQCEAVTPKTLPNRVMVWHSNPALDHTGTWATTRYPDNAVVYVPEDVEMQPTVLDETSPRAAIGEIGNQIHNLACELQDNEDLAEKLECFACGLWRVAQSASPKSAALTVTPQEAAKGSDTKLLDAIAANYWDLKCIDVPTGGGDADIDWIVVEHHMGKKGDVTIAQAYDDDPRKALRRAISEDSQ